MKVVDQKRSGQKFGLQQLNESQNLAQYRRNDLSRNEVVKMNAVASNLGVKVAMKILSSGLLLFLFAVCAAAQGSQAPSAPHNVTVLESKWRIDLYNPALDRDPFGPNKARQQEERKQQDVARDNENRARQGEPLQPPVVRQSGPETATTSLLKAFYIYELKVKNTGRQEIRNLIWEYVFFEPGTTQEVGRLHFASKANMKPGSTKHLVVHSTESPAGTINAAKVGKNPRDQYSEQIVIRGIEYADGSVWSAPLK
jgi:hypothetical protein